MDDGQQGAVGAQAHAENAVLEAARWGRTQGFRRVGRTGGQENCDMLKAFEQIKVEVTASVCHLVLLLAPILRKCEIKCKLQGI